MTTVVHAALLRPAETRRTDGIPNSGVDWIPRGELIFDDAGQLVRVGPRSEPPAGSRVIDHSGRVITPGFVDAHLHLPQIGIRGARSSDLLTWLDQTVFPAEAENADPQVAEARAEETFDELLRHGVTACAAFSSSHTEATRVAFEVAERVGIRAVIGKVLMDIDAPSELLEPAADALDASAKLAADWSGRDGGRLHFAVTPRFGPTSSTELLDGAGRLARDRGLPVQTHLSENPEECRVVADRFGARTATELYLDAGLLDTPSILAHGVHVTPSDLQTLASKSACIVHCPESNFFLHSGRFELSRCDHHGVHTALGSDVGAGTSFSPWEAMRCASFTSTTPVKPERLFRMATVDGARGLNPDASRESWGSLLEGEAADFVVHDVSVNVETIDNVSEFLSRLVHRTAEIRPITTVIRGQVRFGQL